MIDPEKFWPWWERLCKRFNREPDRDMAMDYLAYLDDHGLDTAAAIAGAAQVWATREFFPRPADFLAAEAATAWPVILEIVQVGPRISGTEWRQLRDQVSDRAWQAVVDLGGTTAIADAHDLLRARAEFFRAFECVLVKESQEIAAAAMRRELGTLPETHQLEAAPMVETERNVADGGRLRVVIPGPSTRR